jgi:hypothetical protein
MENLEKTGIRIKDGTTAFFEKISGPRTRAGAVVERAGKMYAKGVDQEVIALQMTKNSPNRHRYTPEFVLELVNLAEDSKTRVVITAEQGRALILDQKSDDLDGELCLD